LSPFRAIFFTALVAILLPYYYYVDRPELRIKQMPTQQESLLDLPGGIEGITLTRGDEKVHYTRMADGTGFQLVEPQGKFVPQDLMKALADLLQGAKSVEVVSTNPKDAAEFGLDQPKGELILDPASKHAPIDIFFGNENPTRTAVYARIGDSPKIFLLGANLEYYQTLMFQWVEGKQGKNA
jgi:Domain of unknown function (DUF4340)